MEEDKYLVAIKLKKNKRASIFAFRKKSNRKDFIEIINERSPEAEIAIADLQ